MDLGQIASSTSVLVSFFREISPIVYLLLAIVLVPFLLDLIFSFMPKGSNLKDDDIEIKTYGRKLTRKERKKIENYLELQRYKEALKK